MISSSTLRPRAKRLLIIAVTVFLFVCACIFQGYSSHLALTQPSAVTIAAVGDTNGYNILQSNQDQEDPLQGINGLLREQDIFIFNFEGVLLSENPPPGVCLKWPWQSLLWSPPLIADFLHPTSLTIATLANNHILDCGSYGIQETIR